MEGLTHPRDLAAWHRWQHRQQPLGRRAQQMFGVLRDIARPDGHAGSAVLARGGASIDLPARIAALGGWLGAGLKGHPVRALPVDQLAHLAAILAGLSEEMSAGLRRQWRCTGHELGQWAEAAVLTRLGDAPIEPAHFWLAAAARTR